MILYMHCFNSSACHFDVRLLCLQDGCLSVRFHAAGSEVQG